MKILGIIAEYNPFHNGHAYQLRLAKEQCKADLVIVAMSGNYVQRGDVAIYDKYLRAEMALQNGADLIVELPSSCATASSEFFAKGAIDTLISLGVNAISFGIEDYNMALFSDIADICIEEPEIYRMQLKSALSRGIPYAKARVMAILASLQNPVDSLEAILERPNNILAISYLMAIKRCNTSVEIVPIRRTNDYHGLQPSDTSQFLSATGIRSKILSGESIAAYVPENTLPLYQEAKPLVLDDFSPYLNYRLFMEYDFSNYPELNLELSNRIQKRKEHQRTFSEWVVELTSKTYTAARVRRGLLHMMLNTNAYAPVDYIRVLGLNADCSFKEIQRNAKQHNVSLLCSSKEINQHLESHEDEPTLMQDLLSYDLYRMTYEAKYQEHLPNERRRKMLIVSSQNNSK